MSTMRKNAPVLLTFALVGFGCKESPPISPPAPSSSTTTTSGASSPPAAASAPSTSVTTEAAASGTASGAASIESGSGATAKVWSFDSDKLDAQPSGFSFARTGNGKEGRWAIVNAADAPSKPNVLAQLEADPTDYRFPLAVVDGMSLKDVAVSVSCKSMSGTIDEACGLVFRYRDAKNYYVTRANALEDNVRLYHVKDGNRVQFASWSGKVAPKIWHALRAEVRGDHFEVFWDGKKVIEAKDATFSEGGKVGLWTKADSVTWFDDLKVTAL